MAITATQTNAVDRVKSASGTHLDDAATPAAATFTVGFKPTRIVFLNVTTRVGVEWIYGMASTVTLHTAAAGTRTRNTGSLITLGSDNRSFTVAASLIAQNDECVWIASE